MNSPWRHQHTLPSTRSFARPSQTPRQRCVARLVVGARGVADERGGHGKSELRAETWATVALAAGGGGGGGRHAVFGQSVHGSTTCALPSSDRSTPRAPPHSTDHVGRCGRVPWGRWDGERADTPRLGRIRGRPITHRRVAAAHGRGCDRARRQYNATPSTRASSNHRQRRAHPQSQGSIQAQRPWARQVDRCVRTAAPPSRPRIPPLAERAGRKGGEGLCSVDCRHGPRACS